MIFITTGSTVSTKFMSPLLEKTDTFKRKNQIKDRIIAQIGDSDYIPQHFEEQFKYTDNIDKYFKKASVVITADGAGTVFRLLELKKKFLLFQIYLQENMVPAQKIL